MSSPWARLVQYGKMTRGFVNSKIIMNAYLATCRILRETGIETRIISGKTGEGRMVNKKQYSMPGIS